MRYRTKNDCIMKEWQTVLRTFDLRMADLQIERTCTACQEKATSILSNNCPWKERLAYKTTALGRNDCYTKQATSLGRNDCHTKQQLPWEGTTAKHRSHQLYYGRLTYKRLTYGSPTNDCLQSNNLPSRPKYSTEYSTSATSATLPL